MRILSPELYVANRERYDYNAPTCCFSLEQTGNLTYSGHFKGIFAQEVPSGCQNGINLRIFELMCQEIFKDTLDAVRSNEFHNVHLQNMKNLSSGIVQWKMASQGGRAVLKSQNMLKKWKDTTHIQLLQAYCSKDLSIFRIGGVRTPTATAFIRFLYPDEFGIMDSRVVGKFTQEHGITTLNVRREDNYINDTKENIGKYYGEYIPFLRKEAQLLNENGYTFCDIDQSGDEIISLFRPCDVEMALFL
ncbi:hypothetical protein DSECCO2_51030 [anaerobic digester metagenome]